MQKVKTNKFLILIILATVAIMSFGASSWLIITENLGIPVLGSLVLQKPTISFPGHTSDTTGRVTVKMYEDEKAVLDSFQAQVEEDDGTFVTIGGTFKIIEAKYTKPSGDTSSSVTGTMKVGSNSLYNVPSVVDANGVATKCIAPITDSIVLTDVVVEFTPTNNKKYATATSTIHELTLYAVVKIGSNYYGTIDSAITASRTGEQVVISESFSDYCSVKGITANATNLSSYKQLQSLTVRKNSTLKSGVTLMVPLNENGDFTKTGTENVYANSGNFAYNSPTSNLKYNVSVGQGVTLTSNGIINVAGTIGGGNGGSFGAGVTVGAYGQLTLMKNAVLNNSGTITCYGFIDEFELNNGSEVINQANSNFTMPFTIYEHRGGSTFLGLTGVNIVSLGAQAIFGTVEVDAKFEAVPFNRFYMPNVTSKLVVKRDAKVYGFTALQISDSLVTTTINIIGNTTDFILQVEDDNAQFEYKYNPNSKVSSWDLYGNMTLNNLYVYLKEVTISASGITVTANVPISSKGLLFPISWYQNFALHKGTDNSNATMNFTQQDIKILPGGSMVIDEGVTVNSNQIIVYGDDFVNANTPFSGDPFGYSNGNSANVASATLIVNGILNSAAFGGPIETTQTGAQLTATNVSVSTKEVSGSGLTDATYTSAFSATATGDLLNDDNTIAEQSSLSAGVAYISRDNNNTEQPAVAWRNCYAVITYNSYGGAYSGDAPSAIPLLNNGDTHTITEDDLAYTPSKDYYTFGGWYADANYSTVPTVGTVINGNYTFHAKWIPIEYTVKYNSDYGTLPNGGTELKTIEQAANALPEIEADGYIFAGWCLNLNNASATAVKTYGDVLEYALNNDSSQVDIFATWTEDVRTYIITYTSNKNSIDVEKQSAPYTGKQALANAQLESVENVLTGHDVSIFSSNSRWNIDEYYYAGGWLNSNTGEPVTDIQDGYFVENPEDGIWYLNLEVNWAKKITVEIFVDVQNKNNGGDLTTFNAHFVAIISDDGTNNSVTMTNETDLSSSVTYEYYLIPGKVLTIKTTPQDGGSGATTQSFTVGTDPIPSTFVTCFDKESCITPETLITLADGSQKQIQHLDGTEQVLTLNHETGKIESTSISRIVCHDLQDNLYEVITLHFDNGEIVEVIAEHIFYDYDLNKYVPLGYDANSYIGHRFIVDANGSIGTATLVNVTKEYRYTRAYELVTVGTVTCFTNNIFSAPAYIDAMLNVFDIDRDTMAYDFEQMQKDIETYGLYTYEDFEGLLTEEEFYAVETMAYLKIAVGKGLMTWEDVLELLNIHYDSMTPRDGEE